MFSCSLSPEFKATQENSAHSSKRVMRNRVVVSYYWNFVVLHIGIGERLFWHSEHALRGAPEEG